MSERQRDREREWEREGSTIRFINGCILLAHLLQADDGCFCCLYASVMVWSVSKLLVPFGRLVAAAQTGEMAFKAYQIHTLPPPIAVPSTNAPHKTNDFFPASYRQPPKIQMYKWLQNAFGGIVVVFFSIFFSLPTKMHIFFLIFR